MVRPAGDPVVHIGAEVQRSPRLALLHVQLDRKERRIVDGDAAFLYRRDEEMLVALALENGGEELHQRRTADGCFLIEPGAVGGDAHVDIAAIGRIPQMHRRWALGPGAARLPGNRLEPARCLSSLCHRAFLVPGGKPLAPTGTATPWPRARFSQLTPPPRKHS